MKFSVTRSGPDLSGVAAELDRAARTAQRVAARQVGTAARKVILDDVRRSRSRGLRMMGGRLGVKSRVESTALSSSVELYAAPAGPWAIVQHGTRPYDIVPRRRQVLAVGKGDVIGVRAHHRATTGRDYWGPATARLDDEVGPIVERVVDGAMRKAAQ